MEDSYAKYEIGQQGVKTSQKDGQLLAGQVNLANMIRDDVRNTENYREACYQAFLNAVKKSTKLQEF